MLAGHLWEVSNEWVTALLNERSRSEYQTLSAVAGAREKEVLLAERQGGGPIDASTRRNLETISEQ